jgi:predicted ribosome quality control (RQC) complex YloA/Tae2 family protein
LLRRVAHAEDIWLHAHQQAGAHVVLKAQAHQDVPDHILQTAAAVAAFYSKGKSAASVEVLYTRAKHVRKMRGARPGQVQVREYRTITVAPQLPTT